MNESERKRWELRNEIRRKVGEGSWAEESEGGDLGIEGEEDHEELQPIAVKGEKRGRESSRVEVEDVGGEKSVGSKKKRRVEEKNEEEEVVQEEEKEVEGGESKPLNRKQKKALKKALEAEAASAPTPTPTMEEKENEGDDGAHEDGEGEGEGKKLNRKQKKALKRAQEAGQVEASPVKASVSVPTVEKKEQVVNGKGVKGKKAVEKKKEPETKAEKLAMEDDFFA